MKNIRNTINNKIKNPYLEMLRLILTSELPIQKQAEMIEALKNLQDSNRKSIDKKVAELTEEILKKFQTEV